MDKSAKLQEVLGKLSSRQAVAVAHGIETERALGQETLPTDLILAALRRQLRTEQAPRVPTLCRLACAGFEDFLTDRTDMPRPPGRISRAVIAPWWLALHRVAGAEMAALEQRFKALIAAGDGTALDAFGEQVARSVQASTELLAQRLADRACDADLKRLFRDPGLLADLQEIRTILPAGRTLRRSVDSVVRLAAQHGQTRGNRLTDLGPEAVTAAKQQYLGIAENFGFAARYFALALLNKLERPWGILRLGRALSWKPNAALVQDTEFGIIGERLIADLQRQAQELCARLAAPDALEHLAEITRALADYLDDTEGLLGEFGFRRDTAWGAQILATRGSVARALSGSFVESLGGIALLVLPQQQRQGFRRSGPSLPDLAAIPDEAVTKRAQEAARLLDLLVKRGVRHGFAAAARATIDSVEAEIERRGSELIRETRTQPTSPAIAAQIAAAAEICDILFEPDRGDLLRRRLRNAQSGAARPGIYGVTPP